jgi:tetratricopeptide (TPR) repeat protein
MALGWFSKGGGTEAKLSKGRKLQEQGRWAEALTYYEEVLQADPASLQARGGARDCRERLVGWNLEEARAYAASDPEKAREHAHLALGLAAEEEDLQREVRDTLQSFEPDRPSSSEAPLGTRLAPSCACAAPCAFGEPEPEHEGEIEDLFELHLESMEAVERELFEPLSGPFREGFVRLQQRRFEEARPLLEEAALQEPDSPAPGYVLGLLAALEEKPTEAEARFRSALELEPGFGPAARHLAVTLRETSRPQEAAEFLGGWLASHPEDGQARLLLSASFLDQGDAEAARREAEEAKKFLAAGDLQPFLLIGQARKLAGDRPGALQAFGEVLRRSPDLLEALVPMGQLLLAEGGDHAARAAEVFKRCYRADPENGWWYLVQVALAYSARGWRKEAREVLGRAREELPDLEEARTSWEAAERTISPR